jgi:AP-2 complex subunit alpha
MASSQPRGLQNFISDIRNCESKEEERARVDKELANIRQKFAASSSLNSYQKKKYVWKMCYIYMLGYDIDFGHIEIISLLSSTKFQEKSVGYMGVALLLKPGDEMLNLVFTSIKNDLNGPFNFGQTLAMAAIGNLGGIDFYDAVGADIERLLVNPSEISRFQTGAGVTYENEVKLKSLTRKKAALCMLRLYRSNPSKVPIAEWVDQMAVLLNDRDIGVLISLMSLLLGFCATSASEFEGLIQYVIDIFVRVVNRRDITPDYLYYQTASPWLHVKCLRFLQYYGVPQSAELRDKLNEALRKILVKMESADSNSTRNGDYSILFEAVNLIITYGADADPRLHENALAYLGRFIAVNDANIRYLGLDAMYKLVKSEGNSGVKQHITVVINSIKDSDVSVRKRALDLLFVMADHSNAEDIVNELLLNLSATDTSIKDDVVIKIAILAEKFAKDLKWYLDTLIKVIMIAGDFVTEDVWHRIVHIVTNHPELHEYAAERLCEIVKSKFAHETSVALGAYILGEFGVNICEKPGCTGYDQFVALHHHFPALSVNTKSILLTTYMKFFNLYPDVRSVVSEVFQKYSSSGHLELQQRACEYLKIPTVGAETMESVLNSMPAYPENRESVLTRRLQSKAEDTSTAPASRPKAMVQGGSNAAAPVPPAAPAAFVDLLSLDEPAPVVSSATLGIPDAVTGKLRAWFNSVPFAAGKQATLYEDSFVRLTVSFEYRAHQGRLVIYVHNLSGDDITDLKFTIPPIDSLRVAITQEPSSRVGFSDQTRVLIGLECLKPFAEPPEMIFEFRTRAGKHVYPLRIPVTAACFLEPVVVDKPTYMQRWASLEGEDRETQEIFQSGKPVTPQLMAFIREALGPALKLGQAQGLDSDTTFTACASFRTGTPAPDGNGLLSVGCMLRLEADPAQSRIRITARAKHGKVAVAVKNVLKAQLI